MSTSSASELELVLLDKAPLQLEREGIKREKMARGWGWAIIRGRRFMEGRLLFEDCFVGDMVEYDNPVTSELPRGLCHGEQRSSWLADRWWCYYDLKELER